MNIDDVVLCAKRYAAGERQEIDLTRIVHDQHAHQSIMAPAALAWWILSERPEVVVRLPADPIALLPLARSGLLFVLTRDDVKTRTHAVVLDRPFGLDDLRRDGQQELRYVDWVEYEGLSPVEGLRAVRDLENPSRVPPPLALRNRRYTWVDTLTGPQRTDHARPQGADMRAAQQWVRRFNGDADQVIYELVSNVHKWAFPTSQTLSDRRAVATCSVSKSQDGLLHIVVMDNGRGIPAAVTEGQQLRLRTGTDWHQEVLQAPGTIGDDPGAALLYLLALYAHGDRNAHTKHEGHGLFTINIKTSRQNRGSIRLLSFDNEAEAKDAAVIEYRSDSQSDPAAARVDLPGAKGTLVYATLRLPARIPSEPAGLAPTLAQTLTPSR